MTRQSRGGRFRKPADPLMASFTESLSFDRELAEVDLRASRAHAAMLRAVGLLSAGDHDAVARGLEAVADDLRTGRFVFRPEDEDIHMAVEAALTAKIGDPARRLHTARSRNDQTAADLRLWLRDSVDRLDARLADVQRALVSAAGREADVVIPGYTHLQRAQPVLLAQHLLAYVEMLARDRERFADARKRINRLPLGACALAGTTLPIDRERVARELGFEGLCDNSMDAVSDRDFAVEFLAAAALAAMHVSRFAEDAILWTSAEWGLATLDDAWSAGSSLMPQKRNPDPMELARGKTGRIYGALMALLTLLKGLPMTYNRDLQEDKPQVFDAARTLEKTLECWAAFIPTLAFDRKRAGEMLRGGFSEATAMAEYLVEKGVPFRRAHEAVGRLVRLAESRGATLAELPLADMRAARREFAKDVFERLNPAHVPKAYRSAGSAGPAEVAKALARWKERLEFKFSRECVRRFAAPQVKSQVPSRESSPRRRCSRASTSMRAPASSAPESRSSASARLLRCSSTIFSSMVPRATRR